MSSTRQLAKRVIYISGLESSRERRKMWRIIEIRGEGYGSQGKKKDKKRVTAFLGNSFHSLLSPPFLRRWRETSLVHDSRHRTVEKRIKKVVSVFSFSFPFSLSLSLDRVKRKQRIGGGGGKPTLNVRSHDKIVDARLTSSWTLHPEGVESGFIAGHVVSHREGGSLVSCSLERKICRSLLNETG